MMDFVARILAVSLVCIYVVEGNWSDVTTDCSHILRTIIDEPLLTNTTTQESLVTCIREFIWKSGRVDWNLFNITEVDKSRINSLIESFVLHNRPRRQAVSEGTRLIFPQTGFRIRREYRRISDGERNAFHNAVNVLKRNGLFDAFANLHMGIVVTSAHGGPNFLGWHRVYLALMEEALRRVNPTVSLPYWDSRLDFHMTDPVNSIIWTAPFLGNGDGFVTTGPFANWQTPHGRLTRNIGGRSTLFSRETVDTILTRCRIVEISEPTAELQYNLEFHHGGPHDWVGGQLSGLNTAAHEPTFFLLHSFVDYLWEIFRIRQRRRCGVDPSRDYPPTMGQHTANRPMDGFPEYRNIDGYCDSWTLFWYRYERSPTCSRRRGCGSPYLRCDLAQSRCVSVARPRVVVADVAGVRTASLVQADVAAPQGAAAVAGARAEEATIDVGQRFPAPPSEPRTQEARFGPP